MDPPPPLPRPQPSQSAQQSSPATPTGFNARPPMKSPQYATPTGGNAQSPGPARPSQPSFAAPQGQTSQQQQQFSTPPQFASRSSGTPGALQQPHSPAPIRPPIVNASSNPSPAAQAAPPQPAMQPPSVVSQQKPMLSAAVREFREKARSAILKAVDADYKGNYAEALKCYKEAVEGFGGELKSGCHREQKRAMYPKSLFFMVHGPVFLLALLF